MNCEFPEETRANDSVDSAILHVRTDVGLLDALLQIVFNWLVNSSTIYVHSGKSWENHNHNCIEKEFSEIDPETVKRKLRLAGFVVGEQQGFFYTATKQIVDSTPHPIKLDLTARRSSKTNDVSENF